jgi:hypothetical protein
MLHPDPYLSPMLSIWGPDLLGPDPQPGRCRDERCCSRPPGGAQKDRRPFNALLSPRGLCGACEVARRRQEWLDSWEQQW